MADGDKTVQTLTVSLNEWRKQYGGWDCQALAIPNANVEYLLVDGEEFYEKGGPFETRIELRIIRWTGENRPPRATAVLTIPKKLYTLSTPVIVALIGLVGTIFTGIITYSIAKPTCADKNESVQCAPSCDSKAGQKLQCVGPKPKPAPKPDTKKAPPGPVESKDLTPGQTAEPTKTEPTKTEPKKPKKVVPKTDKKPKPKLKPKAKPKVQYKCSCTVSSEVLTVCADDRFTAQYKANRNCEIKYDGFNTCSCPKNNCKSKGGKCGQDDEEHAYKCTWHIKPALGRTETVCAESKTEASKGATASCAATAKVEDAHRMCSCPVKQCVATSTTCDG